jgi:hypothetical protein
MSYDALAGGSGYAAIEKIPHPTTQAKKAKRRTNPRLEEKSRHRGNEHAQRSCPAVTHAYRGRVTLGNFCRTCSEMMMERNGLLMDETRNNPEF